MAQYHRPIVLVTPIILKFILLFTCKVSTFSVLLNGPPCERRCYLRWKWMLRLQWKLIVCCVELLFGIV
jgi:hypothetical protein